MFINTIRLNRYIYRRKISYIFFEKKKFNNFTSLFNVINVKPVNDFMYITKNKFTTFNFYRYITFTKKTNKHLWWFFKIFRNNGIIFLPNIFSLLRLNIIWDTNFKKIIYKSSPGNYILLWNVDYIKNRNIFKLPSKKKIIMPLLIFGLLGGHESRFFRKKKLGLYKYKRNKIVRGVAMNPCDHHNGGSSNTK